MVAAATRARNQCGRMKEGDIMVVPDAGKHRLGTNITGGRLFLDENSERVKHEARVQYICFDGRSLASRRLATRTNQSGAPVEFAYLVTGSPVVLPVWGP